MSYDLRVWAQPSDRPAPSSFEEAARTLLELESLKASPNPKFVALAKQMAQRYPIWDEGAGNLSEAVWMTDPVEEARACDKAGWAFSLPADDRVRIMRSVIESASALELTVFDEQLGMVFLPSGQVLPPEKAALWEGVKRELDTGPEPWTKARLRKMIKPLLAAVLKKHGFAPVGKSEGLAYDAEFARPIEGGRQFFSMTVKDGIGHPECLIRATVQNDAVSAVLRGLYPADISINKDPYRNCLVFNVGVFQNFFANGVPVEGPEDVQRVLNMVEQQALPVLDVARTLEGIDRVMNEAALFPLNTTHPLDSRNLSENLRKNRFNALISAWIAKKERFEEVEASYRQRRDVNKAELDRVLGYLREHGRRGMN